MSHITYRIVEHDGGWAYKVGDTFSETFASHDDARSAAVRASREQRVSDDTAFFNLEETGKPGQLVEVGPTSKIFSNPDNKATEDYISGRFG